MTRHEPGQVERQALLALAVLHLEAPGGAERDAGDHRAAEPGSLSACQDTLSRPSRYRLSSTLLNAWPAHASATALISSSGAFQGAGSCGCRCTRSRPPVPGGQPGIGTRRPITVAISCRQGVTAISSSNRRRASASASASSCSRTMPSRAAGCQRARSRVAKDAIALLVDDLLRLGDREGDGVVLACMRVHADGGAPSRHRRTSWQSRRRCSSPRLALRRRRDPIAVVLDRLRGSLLGPRRIETDCAAHPSAPCAPPCGRGRLPSSAPEFPPQSAPAVSSILSGCGWPA